MLLDLLNHHQELFMAVIEPFVQRRDFAQLWRLYAVNKRLMDIIKNLPLLDHSRKYKPIIFNMNLHRITFTSTYYNTTISLFNDRVTKYMLPRDILNDIQLYIAVIGSTHTARNVYDICIDTYKTLYAELPVENPPWLQEYYDKGILTRLVHCSDRILNDYI